MNPIEIDTQTLETLATDYFNKSERFNKVYRKVERLDYQLLGMRKNTKDERLKTILEWPVGDDYFRLTKCKDYISGTKEAFVNAETKIKKYENKSEKLLVGSLPTILSAPLIFIYEPPNFILKIVDMVKRIVDNITGAGTSKTGKGGTVASDMDDWIITTTVDSPLTYEDFLRIYEEKLKTINYQEMAETCYENQRTEYGCYLTSVGMLIRHQLFIEGRDYSAVDQDFVQNECNNGAINMVYKDVANYANSNTKSKSTKVELKTESLKLTRDKLIELLEKSPAGVVIICNGKEKSHAVCVNDYHDGAFWVSDPGSAGNQYVQLEDSSLAKNKKYPWKGSEESVLNAVTRVFYYE